MRLGWYSRQTRTENLYNIPHSPRRGSESVTTDKASILISVCMSFAPEDGRECHRQPWGFLGLPAPIPMETRTRNYGCGFWQVWVTGLGEPTGRPYIYIINYLQSNITLLYYIMKWVPVVSKMKRTVQRGGGYLLVVSKMERTTHEEVGASSSCLKQHKEVGTSSL